MNKILNNQNWHQIQREYEASAPFSYVVIDDFLTSQIFNDVREMLVNDGNWARKNWQVNQLFNREPPFPGKKELLFELRESLPEVLGHLELVKHWAVACHENKGLHIHSDNAAVAVNFWITDDSHNLDSGSGGLRLYKLKRSDEMLVHEFNAMPWAGEYFGKKSPELLANIPYKKNRAVIFNAEIFHSSDEVKFSAESLESVRIGVTMALTVSSWS